MQAAAQAAVQAAMAGVNPPDSVGGAKMDGAGATRAASSRETAEVRCTAAELAPRAPGRVGPERRGLGLPFELTSVGTE